MSDRRTVWIGLLLVELFVGETRADYPPVVRLTEVQPPSLEDWLDLHLRTVSRCTPRCCPEPIWLDGRVIYFEPCGPEPCSGAPCRRHSRGVYGVRHPMPYYIPAVTIHVAVPAPCPRCLVPDNSPAPHNRSREPATSPK